MSLYEQFSENDLAVLKARAIQAGRNSRDDQNSEAILALSVQIDEELYALPVETLIAVHNDIPIVPIPCVPPFVVGMANIRGHILPVIELSVLLNASGEAPAGSGTLVVSSYQQATVAFRVDSVGEVAAIAQDGLSPVPAAKGTEKSAYLQGMHRNGTALLEVEAILRDASLIVSEAVS
jgi:purine-binding chemotaxis protein CheW